MKLTLLNSNETVAQPTVSSNVDAKGRTPEQVAADKERMAALRAKRAENIAARKTGKTSTKSEPKSGGAKLVQTSEQIKPAAKAEKSPEDKMKFYKNAVHARWNYYTQAPDANFTEVASAEVEAASFAVKLGLKLPGLKLIPTEGFEYVLCLRHRATGVYVTVWASKQRLTFASTFQDKASVPSEIKADLEAMFSELSK